MVPTALIKTESMHLASLLNIEDIGSYRSATYFWER